MSRAPSVAEGPASDAGVVFPRDGGTRSTMSAGRRIVAAATQRVDTAIHESARDEEDWRSHYLVHFRALTLLSAQQHASLVASDGLRAVHNEFKFLRLGAELPITEALTVPRANFLSSWSVSGSGTSGGVLSVPYLGSVLRGDELLKRCDDWTVQSYAST